MLTTYLAGYIENNPKDAKGWRDEIIEKLSSPNILIYCPIKYEAYKTGKQAPEMVQYITGLKQGGHWEVFRHEMRSIWFGNVDPKHYRFEILKQFQYRKIIDGNHREDLGYWGDFEAVARSDFIIVMYKHNEPSWGTPAEALTAFFLNIPIYVISDVPKTKMNSSLLWWVIETGGEVFYKLDDCVQYIKKEYKI